LKINYQRRRFFFQQQKNDDSIKKRRFYQKTTSTLRINLTAPFLCHNYKLLSIHSRYINKLPLNTPRKIEKKPYRQYTTLPTFNSCSVNRNGRFVQLLSVKNARFHDTYSTCFTSIFCFQSQNSRSYSSISYFEKKKRNSTIQNIFLTFRLIFKFFNAFRLFFDALIDICFTKLFPPPVSNLFHFSSIFILFLDKIPKNSTTSNYVK